MGKTPRRNVAARAANATRDPQRPDAEMLLAAYSMGIFPMASGPKGQIEWYSPDPRGVLPLRRFHVPTTVGRLVRQGRYEIRVDTQVTAVLDACAGRRSDDNGSWMSGALRRAYIDLHARGHLHSVEAWRDGTLVGGLYGVRIGGAFFGESMFVRPDLGGSNSSKVCLVHLVERLLRGGFRLLDTQMVTDHMQRFGAVEIPGAEYSALLDEALGVAARWEVGEDLEGAGARPGVG